MEGYVRNCFSGELIKVPDDPCFKGLSDGSLGTESVEDLDQFGYPDSHCCSVHAEGGYCSVCGALLHSDENGEGW